MDFVGDRWETMDYITNMPIGLVLQIMHYKQDTKPIETKPKGR
jgi:hypothetical protein